MGKDSHFTGQPVYSQVLKLLDKEKILQMNRCTNSLNRISRFISSMGTVSTPYKYRHGWF